MSTLALRSRFSRWQNLPVFALALLLLVTSSAPVSRSHPASAEQVSSLGLYAGPDWRHFFALDPQTLDYRKDVRGFTAEPSWTDWAVSADGSTMVVIEDSHSILVHDGFRGTERFRFESARTLYGPRLNGDGSRLLVSVPSECGESACLRFDWYLFDTRTGVKLRELEQPKGQLFESLVDGDLHRLYATVIDGDKERPGRWPVTLIAYDLDTGAEFGRLALPGITYAARFPMAADGTPIFERWIPAVALSPDGTRLAVVDYEGTAITLVDTATFTIGATRRIHRDESTLTRTARWLGFVPSIAEAKINSGRSVSLVFAPDTRRVYLTGFEGSADESTGEASARGLGLTVIDVESGEILKQSLDDAYLETVIPTLDRRDIYVYGPTALPWAVENEVPYRLLRLDSDSLSVEAEHVFNGPYSILFVPPATA